MFDLHDIHWLCRASYGKSAQKISSLYVQELIFYSTLKICVFVQNVTLQFYLFRAYFRKHLCQNALLYSF